MTAVKESPVLVKLEAAAQRVDEINRLLSDPSVLGQTSEIQRLNKERAELIAQGELYHEFSALLKQIAETEDLREDPHPEVRDLARNELKQLQGRRAELESRAKALEFAGRNGERSWEGWARLGWGELALRRGDRAAAAQHFDEAQEIAEELGTRPLLERCRVALQRLG